MARDEKLKEITERLEQGIEELFQSDRYMEYLRTMSQFHNYSFNNTLLIAMQKPEATLVAGYQAWQKKFKRNVMRGEKGIQIIAPAMMKEKQEVEKIDPDTNEPILRDDGQPETETVEVLVPRFRVATVFDVSQTEGEPLPGLGAADLTASVENYEMFMEAVKRVSPVPIRFDEIEGETHGYYHQVDKEIVIKAGMSESQTLKTSIHEVSHATLHDRDMLSEKGEEKDSMTREVEAESVAFSVCQYFGLDTSDYSFPYIAGWSSGRDAKELKASMETIRKTAGTLIDAIGEQLNVLQREREMELLDSDVVLKLSEQDRTAYFIVRNMAAEEIRQEIEIYHGMDSAFKGEMEEFLKGLGADVIPLWDSAKENKAVCPTFYTLEYDTAQGITALQDLSCMAYAQMQIDRTEYMETLFSDEERNLIVNLAYKFDNKKMVDEAIHDIKEASYEPDMRGTYRIVAEYESRIRALPDSAASFTDMHDYGYYDAALLPLTRQGAEELYGKGLPVYRLYPDNTEAHCGDISEIMEHEGMFGVDKTQWEIYLGKRQEIQNGRYQEVEVFEIPMLYSDTRIPEEFVPEGMFRYDLRGADIDPGHPVMIENSVLVNHAATVLSTVPLYLRDNEALRLGDGLNFTGGVFTIDQYKSMMAGFPREEKAEAIENAIGQANERLHWNGDADRYAIYQINEDGPARKSLFMSYEYNQEHGNPVTGVDYHMVYSGVLLPDESLNSLYEKFNLRHPENYRGHSLSVSDVVMVQRNGRTEAHYVDSFGFQELPDFVEQRQQVYQAYAMFVDTHAVHENSTGIAVEQHEGTWHTVDEMDLNGMTFYLMEHDVFQQEVPQLIVDGNGTLVAHELENGFDAGALEAVREYLMEQGIPVYDRKLTELPELPEPEAQEQPEAGETEPAENEPETEENKDGDDKESHEETEPEYPKVYRHPVGYAKENGEMEQFRQSRRLNIGCKERIEQLIRENFDGMHLASGAVLPAIEEYGTERVAYVLATTVQLKDYDGRFSMANKAWANTIQSVPDIRNNYDARTDYLVESHPAVLDGFINEARKVFQEREQQVNRETPHQEVSQNDKAFIDRYYVVDNLQKQGALDIQHYEKLDAALSAYFQIPNHKVKALGVVNSNPLPGSLDFIQCKNGIDTLIEDYQKVEGWNLPEIDGLVEELEYRLAMHDTVVSYHLENADRYFTIQTSSEGGYDYTFYDGNFLELDGGIYDDPEISIEEAITDILEDEGMSFADCKVMVPGELEEKVEEAEKNRALTAESVVVLKGKSHEYDAGAREMVYTFDCVVNGEPAELTYTTGRREHFYSPLSDRGEMEDTFSIHTTGRDIWEQMPTGELTRLEAVLAKEAKAYLVEEKIRDAIEIVDLKDVYYDLMETPHTAMTKTHWERIWTGMSDKGSEILGQMLACADTDRAMNEVKEQLTEAQNLLSEEQFEKMQKQVEEREVFLAEEKPYPMNSDSLEPEDALNGLSKAMVEEMVLCYAQAEIDEMGLTDEVNLLGARVYGSRMREGLYTENSDLDVVLSYSGDISEDTFFNALNESGMTVAGIPLDINPISLEKTGPLKDYMEKAETFLDEKEAQKQATIHDLKNIHTEPEKKEEISFFFAECAEFHVLGEYHEGLTLQEAMDYYKQIPADRINGIKSIGFHLYDGSIYDGGEYDLYSGGRLLRDDVDMIQHYKESPAVQKALDELQDMINRGELQGEKTVTGEIMTEPVKKEPEIAAVPKEKTAKPQGRNEKKESVIQALKERQARLKAQEKTKPDKEKVHTKGDIDL